MNETTKLCPHCQSEIPIAATVCKVCRRDIAPVPPIAVGRPTNQVANFWIKAVRACIAIAVAVWGISYCANHTSAFQDASQSSAAGGAALSKADEISKAASGPTATQVAGNASKWQGAYVHFPCKIDNVIAGPEANATCGKGVTVSFDESQPNIDYSDPDAVDKAMKQDAARSAQQFKTAEDQAMIVLAGSRVSDFDGGQIVTITGQVLGPQSGTNAMGATLDYPTIRVDYAE